MTDVATKMLNALTGYKFAPPRVSADQQMKYLQTHLKFLSLDERKYLARLLFRDAETVKHCAEGIIVNMDLLSVDQLLLIYDYAHYCVSKR